MDKNENSAIEALIHDFDFDFVLDIMLKNGITIEGHLPARFELETLARQLLTALVSSSDQVFVIETLGFQAERIQDSLILRWAADQTEIPYYFDTPRVASLLDKNGNGWILLLPALAVLAGALGGLAGSIIAWIWRKP